MNKKAELLKEAKTESNNNLLKVFFIIVEKLPSLTTIIFEGVD